MNKKQLAQTLFDIAKNSTTTVIEVADDEELISAAQRIGIVIPSPDLALLKTVYAEIDKSNLNGVILSRKEVEKGLPTLIGKQVNWEHMGAGQVCGYVIDASIKENRVEIIAVVFKSLFPEEFDIVKEKFANGKLAVSFEIWNKDPLTGESTVKEVGNGLIEVSPIIFHGTGLLLTSKPACPKAKVYKLLAQEVIDAEKIVEKVFNEDLVYAEFAIEKSICKNCNTCNCKTEEEHKLEELNVNASGDTQEKASRKCKICGQILPEDKDEKEDFCSECKTKATTATVKPEETTKVIPEETIKPVETTVVAEATYTEVAHEQPVAEVVKEQPVKTTSHYVTETIETVGLDGGVDYQSKSYEKIVRVYKDGHEEIEIREGNSVNDSKIVKYTSAQLEEKINTVKAEYQEKLDASDKEKKDTIEAKDKEVTTMKEELGKKDQAIAELTTIKAKENGKPDLTVGSVTSNTDSYQEAREQVNLKAFGHK